VRNRVRAGSPRSKAEFDDSPLEAGLGMLLLDMLRVGRVSVATHHCLLGHTDAYYDLSKLWLPVSSGLSACYCWTGIVYLSRSLR
jgi:hypothetical protein